MGLGGCVGIINATPFTWTQIGVSSYQFISWDSSFPSSIKPGDVFKNYIEWDTGIFVDEGDTFGSVTFQLDNPSSTTFEFHALHPDGQPYNVYVNPSNFDVANANHDNDVINLGFIHDECVAFYLSGEQEHIYANSAPVDWMHSTLDVIGNETLQGITLPGSHDAGIGPDVEYGTVFATPANVRTQGLAIGGQLIEGVRWFDIRPVIGDGGKWLTGHYSGGDNSQGANGESIEEIILQLNTFLSVYQELVILELSHAYNTDDDYRDLNQDEWNTLFDTLTTNVKYLYTEDVPDLSTIKISDFIADGPSVLIVARPDDTITLGSYSTAGIHPDSSFKVFNSYADSSDPDAVISDQLNKMANWRTIDPSQNVFLLSWTETENGIDNVFGNGIEANAYEINQRLFGNVAPVLSANNRPNIIMEDWVQTNEMVSFSMAINWLQQNLWN
ncbi:PLC-like phosphodiesterase [Melanomma pulvis-pyrius CBS 109.77]|uniref:PLC-like phosphodiesterase n=1 Tax=Melanomma pulvis-pyrius CBS 109.77 TaxID=1314802 RepID=A0A6A6XS39_9PLEO|nr:PLC-like phosphodiesterase [Melanomma pulvis-pyrius CBS 109.77]